MNPAYAIRDTSNVYSPSLLFFKDLIQKNIALAVQMVGDPKRLRPHVKTHKTREIVRMELAAGIVKHKCATLAEAEMVASCGAPDVFIAYNIVGPNRDRLARLIRAYPGTRFSVQADHPDAVRALSETMHKAGLQVDVLMDIDVGMHRTGIAPGEDAVALYQFIARLPGLRPGGLHSYDGHNHQESLEERHVAVKKLLEPVLELRSRLEKKDLPVPRLIGGGTPTFPVWARLDIPGLECSPGTCFLHDNGYGSKFAEMSFTPAALLLTRVISKPTPTRLTLDLGYKAVASDPPAGKRCILLNVPESQPILQNEEHFVIETPQADRFAPGAEVFAMPTHICPTCAMHRTAYVVEGGQVTGQWDIAARDRVLTV
jgi:D-serine deaminase-like pyridoxal phosphate-dependent protein